jgi:hypothetical protein
MLKKVAQLPLWNYTVAQHIALYLLFTLIISLPPVELKPIHRFTRCKMATATTNAIGKKKATWTMCQYYSPNHLRTLYGLILST